MAVHLPTLSASMRAFENELISISRMKLYEQCAYAFYCKYVRKGPRAPASAASMFGIVLHAALEMTYQYIQAEEYRGLFPVDVLVRAYRDAWAEANMVGVDLYAEGLQILRAYAARIEYVNHFDILDTEREFNVTIEGFRLNGYIDLVKKVDDDTVAIKDFKSNRLLFTGQELDSDVQLSVYGYVARQLYPWAKSFVFEFEMLRHNLVQKAIRTPQQIEDTVGYIVTLAKKTEEPRPDDAWKATLNANCAYCDHRERCDTYKGALEGKVGIPRGDLKGDMEELAKEHQVLTSISKAAYGRKAKIEDVFRAHMAQHGNFEAAGHEYQMQGLETVYPPSIVNEFVAAGLPRNVVYDRVLSVNEKGIEGLMNEVKAASPKKATLLEAKLNALAERKPPARPRVDSRPIKIRK